MRETSNHDRTGDNREKQTNTRKLVLPEGYDYRGEVDIETITSALEQYADNLADAG